jgi:transcriptional regulator with PAS, ATPase and Fis domain|tara:strand:+ start:1035 stop:2300 length:1266 start_codon:yes stop_codon:yes gene_type:complete
MDQPKKIMSNIQNIKQRFGIIGNDSQLNFALEKAIRVAPTEISVLVTGESGVGKEVFPRIIHQLSKRKHGKYIAVNCGAIPEGTIDSELFGHEKGAFTGATQNRSGYFEEANGGTIFLDEVGELPAATQVRLLRVLENGEFLRVGSSKIQKTDVRVVAATNIVMSDAIHKNKFREDLYYRLSTVEINLPPLRKRLDDIHLLFRKFAADFAQKYRMPTVRLDSEAQKLLINQKWSGNVRQLRNIAEQLSVLETERSITPDILNQYLPSSKINLPAIIQNKVDENDFSSEREILYKVLFDMRSDLNDLKKLTQEIMNESELNITKNEHSSLIKKIYGDNDEVDFNFDTNNKNKNVISEKIIKDKFEYAEEVREEETLSIQDKELELIIKALERNNRKRKAAASELGISERTLYRKIKQYNIDL